MMYNIDMGRLGQQAKSYKIDIDLSVFNSVYTPYLDKIIRYAAFYGGSGSGKCLGEDTPVLMYSGEIKKVQDIIVGDLLMGPDSTPRTVISITNGTGELYNVKQSKAMDYVVNSEHILCLFKRYGIDTRPGRHRRFIDDADYVEIPVKDWLNKSNKWKDAFVGYRTGVEFAHRDVTVDPYFLGIWLGDGTSNNTNVTTMDPEIKNFIYEYADKIGQDVIVVCAKGRANTYKIKGNEYSERFKSEFAKQTALRDTIGTGHQYSVKSLCEHIGMSNKNAYTWKNEKNFKDMVLQYKKNPESVDVDFLIKYMESPWLLERMREYNLIKNKHIPEDFMYNDLKTRLDVLAGIIDTDGYCYFNCYEITQKNERLARQIRQLAHSVGLRCSIKETRKECVNNGVFGTYYRLTISGNTNIIPTKIQRKKIEDWDKKNNMLTSSIKVEPVGVGKYYGFFLDGDHKFLLGDGTVTHNSYFISQMLTIRLSTMPNRNLMIVRKELTACIASCWNQMLFAIKSLGMEELWKKDISNHILTFCAKGSPCDGAQIVFRGLDDVSKAKSVMFPNGVLTDVWIEEATEVEKSDLYELDRRLRGGNEPKSLIVSFNPIFREHWIRNWMLDELRYKNAMVLKTTYRDNRFLAQEDIDVIEDYRRTSPYDAMVYADGEFGITGQTVFNRDEIYRRTLELQNKYKIREPLNTRFQWEEDDYGGVKRGSEKWVQVPAKGDSKDYLHIYVPVADDHPYVLIVDTAGDGSDFYAAHVMDNATQEQVAVYHSSETADICIMQIYCMGRYYNNALLAPEVNYDSYPVKKLIDLGYTNLYQRETGADYTGQAYAPNIGWRTTSANRTQMISTLIEWVNKGNINKLNDLDTLSEMLTFVMRTKKKDKVTVSGRMEAASGAHDDLVISLAMYLQVCGQQETELMMTPQTMKGIWLPSELDDKVKSGKITSYDRKVYNRDVSKLDSLKRKGGQGKYANY